MTIQPGYPTPFADINGLLEELLSGIKAALGGKLTGFCLYGSLVWGSFDHDLSDIDTLATVASHHSAGTGVPAVDAPKDRS